MVSFDGKGSVRILEKNKRCPKCKGRGIYYLGSDVIRGNPMSPASDAEVDHHFQCRKEKCQHEWTKDV
jgi:hypothetical protein